jgi:hypothetical protein
VLTGEIAEQSQLPGVLDWMWNLGLDLETVLLTDNPTDLRPKRPPRGRRPAARCRAKQRPVDF